MSSNPLPANRFAATRAAPHAASDRLLLALLGAAVLFYFVVRGWLNAVLVVAGLSCIGSLLAHRRELGALLRRRDVRWLALALAAPMLAAVVVNLGHHEAVSRSFDAALRFLLALAVFLELRRRRLDYAPVAALAFPGALALCAGLVIAVPEASTFYWDGRYATYFIDPIVLCQHVLISAFICLFLVDRRAPDARWKIPVLVVGIGLALALALGTQSRGGWAMVPLLAVLWLLRDRRVSAPQVAGAVGVVLLACALAYWGSGVIRMRVDQVSLDIAQYTSGANRDTSVGLRLSLFRTALVLFAQHPWLGWGYETLPALDGIPAIAPYYTPALQSYFTGAGVHNEFLQAMMRMGVVGLASRVLLYAVPFWLFARGARSPAPAARLNGRLGLVVVIGYVTTGFTSEVTNLIYAASFYALLVAVFAAGALPPEAPA